MIRYFSILLLSVYFFGTLGLKINRHYCCGELVAWEFLFGQQPRDCDGETPKTPKKCCENKVQVLETDDSKPSQPHLSLETRWLPEGGPVPVPFLFSQNPVRISCYRPIVRAKEPPDLLVSVPDYLRFRNLRI